MPELQPLGTDTKLVSRIQRSLRTRDLPRFNVPKALKQFAGHPPPAETVLGPEHDRPESESAIQQASASEQMRVDANAAKPDSEKPDPEKTEAEQGSEKEGLAPVVMPSVVQASYIQPAPAPTAPLPVEKTRAD